MNERKREREVLGRDEEKGTKRERLIEIEIDEELERERGKTREDWKYEDRWKVSEEKEMESVGRNKKR